MWTFDGTTWSQVALTGSFPEEGAAMAPLDGTLVLFGGGTGEDDAGNCPFFSSETWTWDGTSWREVSTQGPGRWFDGTMSALGPNLLLVGGLVADETNCSSSPLVGTWIWDGTAWAQLQVDGPPDWQAVMATE